MHCRNPYSIGSTAVRGKGKAEASKYAVAILILVEALRPAQGRLSGFSFQSSILCAKTCEFHDNTFFIRCSRACELKRIGIAYVTAIIDHVPLWVLNPPAPQALLPQVFKTLLIRRFPAIKRCGVAILILMEAMP